MAGTPPPYYLLQLEVGMRLQPTRWSALTHRGRRFVHGTT
jgi:hypothetical protein